MAKLTCRICGAYVTKKTALDHARTHCTVAPPRCTEVCRTRLPGAHVRCRTCAKPFWGRKTRDNHEKKCAEFTVQAASGVDSSSATIIMVNPRTYDAMPFLTAIHQDPPSVHHRLQSGRQMYR